MWYSSVRALGLQQLWCTVGIFLDQGLRTHVPFIGRHIFIHCASRNVLTSCLKDAEEWSRQVMKIKVFFAKPAVRLKTWEEHSISGSWELNSIFPKQKACEWKVTKCMLGPVSKDLSDQ